MKFAVVSRRNVVRNMSLRRGLGRGEIVLCNDNNIIHYGWNYEVILLNCAGLSECFRSFAIRHRSAFLLVTINPRSLRVLNILGGTAQLGQVCGFCTVKFPNLSLISSI